MLKAITTTSFNQAAKFDHTIYPPGIDRKGRPVRVFFGSPAKRFHQYYSSSNKHISISQTIIQILNKHGVNPKIAQMDLCKYLSKRNSI